MHQRLHFECIRMGPHFKRDPAAPDSVLEVDYLIDGWLVGSPATVVDKIGALQRRTGGFGTLLLMIYDFSTESGAWEESLRRLVEEVLPHFPD